MTTKEMNRNKLNKGRERPFIENCYMLLKEIKDTNKQKILPVHGLEELALLKWYKAIYIFNVIPTKIRGSFLKEIEQKIPQICVEPQKSPKTKANLEKQSQKYHTPSLKIMLQRYSNQNSWVLAEK